MGKILPTAESSRSTITSLESSREQPASRTPHPYEISSIAPAEQPFFSPEWFTGEAEEILLENESEIDLLTWNVLGLPNEDDIRPWEDRIDGIAETILEAGAEVVVLQECFEKELSLGLFARLSEKYAHAYLHLESKTPLPSGLALFSKIPIGDFTFTPHCDLLDSEREESNMGTFNFTLLNKDQIPLAHITASHFQGSSNCEWRVGVTEDGKRLSYAEVRKQEAIASMQSFAYEIIPHYLCGDLNVDRRYEEYLRSSLNSINGVVFDPMNREMKMKGTNTNFWRHKQGLAKMYPELTPEKAVALALIYKKLYEEQLHHLLKQDPWNKTLSDFESSFLSDLEHKLQLDSEDERKVWEYCKVIFSKAINKEKILWQMNQNDGEAPQVSIGRVIEIRACPIEESLDYVLGLNPFSTISKIEILQGYVDSSIEKTYSDHHPILARIRVSVSKTNLER